MSGIRLYIRETKKKVGDIFELLSSYFWDANYAVATGEISEQPDLCEVSLYIMADEEVFIRIRLVSLLQENFADVIIQREVLPNIDWVSKSMAELKPVRSGRFIIHGAHDRQKLKANNFAIEIETGQAFGTGYHGTTVGCLELIDVAIKLRPCHNALDLGTGSGVLAIAIAKAGKIPVLGTDMDPIAVRIAKENASLNQVTSQTKFERSIYFEAKIFHKKLTFDLIVANIFACSLLRIAPQLATYLPPGGFVILSGIPDLQRWRVLAVYRRVGIIHRRMLYARDGQHFFLRRRFLYKIAKTWRKTLFSVYTIKPSL